MTKHGSASPPKQESRTLDANLTDALENSQLTAESIQEHAH
jgi:hypothetical protein